MRNFTKQLTRFISLSVVSALLFSSLPAMAFAQDAPSVPENPSTQQTTTSRPVKVSQDRTSEFCTTYEMSDGTYQAKLSQTPLNYQDKNGTWKEIDTALSKESTTVGQANTPAVALSPNSLQEDLAFKRQIPGSSPVTLQGEDYALTLNMLNACEGTPQAKGSVSTYKEVAPSTDLSYEVLTNGIKETLYLSSKEAPTEFSFNMRTFGLESRETSHGLALFKEGESEPVYTFGDLVVFDSSKNEADEPAYDRQATMTYQKTASGLSFTYHLSKDWLSDPARVFPVQVDPSLTKNASDTFISSAFPGTNYSGSTELKVGRYDASTGYNRALIRYTLTDIPSDAYISSATLRLYQTHTYYTDTATTAYLGLVKKSWTSSNTWSSLKCSKGDTGLFSSYRSKSFSGRGVHVSFDVASAVRDWVNGSAANNGFCLYQKEGTASQEPECWRKFSSANISNNDNKPQLIINYTVPQLGAVSFEKTPASSANTSLAYPTFSYTDDIGFYCSLKGNYSNNITSIRALINETEAPAKPRSGQVAWFPTAPDGATWEYYALPSERGGGYIAKSKGEATGSASITLIPEKCSTTLSGSGDAQVRTVKFLVKPTAAFSGSLINHIDSYASMNNGWSKGYINNGGTFGLVPSRSQNKITSIATTASAKFFKINAHYSPQDKNNFNTERDSGRGSIKLTWAKNPQATGYKITFYDGAMYREVADIPSANITSWSSKDSGMFPADALYKAASQDSVTAPTLFNGAKSPALTPQILTLSANDSLSNAGLAASDGEHYYVHSYVADSSAKTPVVRYDHKGKNPQKLNYSFANNANSLLCINNALYSSVLSAPSALEGVRFAGSSEGDDSSEKPSYLKMDEPFMYPGGTPATRGANILVCANENYIVNIAVLSGGILKARIFKDDGTFVGDKTLANVTFGALDSVALDASNTLAVVSKGPNCQVTKVALDVQDKAAPLRLITRYGLNRTSAPSRSISYNQTSNIYFAGSLESSQSGLKIYTYAGPGYDLSDNVNALYNAVKNPYSQTYYNDRTNYAFTVVPYNSVGQDYFDYDALATGVANLEGRSLVAAERSVAQEADEREVLGLDASVSLPKGGLKLSKEVASLTSYGPDVSLSLLYDSSVPSTTPSMLGVPSLDISAHTRLELSATGSYLYYYDDALVRHVFSALNESHTRYVSSIGTDAYIERVGTHYVMYNESRDMLTFDEEGKPLSIADRNQNTVSYEWEGSELKALEAANKKRLTFGYTPSGQLNSISGPGVNIALSHAPRSFQITNTLTHKSWSFEVDAAARLSRITDEAHSSYVPQLDASGRLSSEHFQSAEETAPLRAASYTWSGDFSHNNRTLIFERAGKKAKLLTDERGLIKSATQYVSSKSTQTDPFEGVASTFNGFDRCGNLIEQNASPSGSPGEGTTERWAYDARGNELRHVTALGRITKTYYNEQNDVIKTVDPSGQIAWNTYDSRGNLILEKKLIDDSGQKSVTEYTYGQVGAIKGVCTQKRVALDENKTQWATTRYSDFDSTTANPCTTTEVGINLGAGTRSDLVSKSVYDAQGNVIQEEDALGAKKLSYYDAGGRLIKVVDERGKESIAHYDPSGNVTESYDVSEGIKRNWTKTTYNIFGDSILERKLDGDGTERARTETRFDEAGNPYQTDDSTVAGVAQSTYDAQGNELSSRQEGLVEGARGVNRAEATNDATTLMEYDTSGNMTSVKEVGVDTEALTEYSDDDEILSQSEADGSVTDSVYDPQSGQKIKETQLEGSGDETIAQTSHFVLNKASNVELEKEPDGARALYTYDLLGHVLSAKMPGSKETTSTYNELGWPVRIEERYLASNKPGTPGSDLVLITTFSYDKAGRVLSKRIADDETTYTYNGAGDLITQTNPDGSSLSNTYNGFGDIVRHVEHATDESLARDTSYSYDALDREIAALDKSSFGVSRESTYTTSSSQEDTAKTGEVSTTTYTTPHFKTHLTTNTSQQFESATLSRETSEVARMKVDKRDGAGRILALNSSLLPHSLTRTFDEAGRLTTMSFEPSATQSYAYMDNSSKLSGWNMLGRAESFGYDKDTGRLSKSSEATYTFGGSSALPLRKPLAPSMPQYAPPSPDATRSLEAPVSSIPEPDASDYTFNAKGQRTKVHAGSQPAALTWQGERLLSLETSNTRANYAYDASGMRIKADLTGAHGASQTLRYTYDGLRLLEVSSKSSTDTSNFSIGYLYEADNQTPSAASYETSSASVPFTLESNVRGDVIALRDKAGDIFARYTYSEYGVCKAIKTNATECIDESLAHAIAHNQPLRYAGYVYDEYSQMYYCAARYYDPATQVFVSLDPARADGERSGYLYCDGDPVNHTDPSGEERKLLSVPVYNQGRNPTCLYVALKAIIKYVKGKSVKVRKLIDQGFTNINDIDHMGQNRDKLKKIYGIKSDVANGRKSYSSVKLQINKNRPLMAYGTGNGGGHAFNIIGYKKYRGKNYFAIANWGAKKWRKVGALFGKDGVKWDKANNRIRWPEANEGGRAWYGFRK